MKATAPFLISAALAFAVRPASGQAGTGNYEPASKAEAALALQAKKDIYPRQVRDSLTRYSSVLVVWPGIVRSVAAQASGDSLTLSVEHHYFDWKEDHGCQRELYFVSPRGEGTFKLTIPSTAAEAPGFTGKAVVGALVIAYGIPTTVDSLPGEAAISLTAKAANIIESTWYRTDAFSYGRGFAEFKLLKIPACSR